MNNLSDISVIKSVLSRHGFTFSKALGQNFIINPGVCPRIAEEGGPELVDEINKHGFSNISAAQEKN